MGLLAHWGIEGAIKKDKNITEKGDCFASISATDVARANIPSPVF